MKLTITIIILVFNVNLLFSQCIEPNSVALYSTGFYDNDVILKDYGSQELEGHGTQVAIDTAEGTIAWAYLWSVNRDDRGVEAFSGIQYAKSRTTESFYTWEKGVLSGPVFMIRKKDGFYAQGYCENDSCVIKEFYPDGSLYSEYSTIDKYMVIGNKKVYDRSGKRIYECEFMVYEQSVENRVKYCSDENNKCTQSNGKHMQVKVMENCW